jgi:hypothetical protein
MTTLRVKKISHGERNPIFISSKEYASRKYQELYKSIKYKLINTN